MEPKELEYFAGKEFIGIVPKFNVDIIYLVDGALGPLKAGLPSRVPLWIALHLRRKEKCTLIPPDWMNRQYLEAKKREEREDPKFTKMPSEHYLALAKVICSECPQDIPDADEVKTLIKDIWDNRVSKLRTAVQMFINSAASFAKVDNVTQMEMATVRPFFPQAIEQYFRIKVSASRAVESAAAAHLSMTSNSEPTQSQQPQPSLLP